MVSIPRSSPFVIAAAILGVLVVEWSQPSPEWGQAFARIAFIILGAATFLLPALWESVYGKWFRRRRRHHHRRQPRKRSAAAGSEE